MTTWKQFYNKLVVAILKVISRRSKADYPKHLQDKTRENFKNQIKKHNDK